MLLERRDIRGGSYAAAPSLAPEASLGEIYSAEYDANRLNWLTISEQYASEQAYDEQIDRIKAATGIGLDNPWRTASNLPPVILPKPGLFGLPSLTIVPAEAIYDNAFGSFAKRQQELAEQFPDKRDVIAPDKPIGARAAELARESATRSDETFSRGGNWRYAARLAAGLTSSFEDPAQLMALMFGPQNEVGAGARAVLWNATKVGAANATVEVASYPAIRDWREKAGMGYSLSELGEHTGAAFLFGAGIDAGGRALFRGVSGLRGEPTPAPPVGDAADRALDAAAATLPPESVVRRAAGGDLAALDELAVATGQAEDPAVRGARTAAALEDGLETAAPHVDPGDGLSRLAQAIRSSLDETEPPPGHADPVPPARTPDLSDDAPAPLTGRSFSVDGKAVTFRDVDVAQLVPDAAMFQFKAGGDVAGATARLSGVESWDPIAAGRGVVFERKNGELVPADGHQRTSLGKRLLASGQEQEIALPAFVFREVDGWTPGDVRALAAKKNLQEGSGTTVDAAKIIRERPDIIDASVPLSSDAMRQARSLARLSDEAFGKVAAGIVPANHAAMIGDLVPDKAMHSGMIDELVAADPANAREARFIVSELMQAPVQHEVQLTLLGAETIARPLLRERAKVLDAALKILREDKRIFGLLEREAGRIERAGNALRRDANASAALEAEAVSAVIEQLAANRGPVSDWLTDAARDIAGDAPVRKAAETFAKRVRDALQKDGLAGLAAAPPEPLRANGFDDVTGPEAKSQVEALEAQFADPKQGGLFDELEAVKREGAIGVIVEGCQL
jgi:hypothetical protein